MVIRNIWIAILVLSTSLSIDRQFRLVQTCFLSQNEDLFAFQVLFLLAEHSMDICIELVQLNCPCGVRLIAASILRLAYTRLFGLVEGKVVLSRRKTYIL